MTLRNTAINCALLQSLWTWRTLLSLILLSRFLPHAQSSDGNETTTKSTLSSTNSTTAPEKINLKSLLGSSEAVQKLLQNNKAFLPFVSSEASSNPQELNKLVARLKPKQGRFDPALIDMLSTFENFGGSIPNIFGNGNSHDDSSQSISRRHPTSTEENAIIWSTTVEPNEESSGVNKQKVIPYVRNRFSSKFRNKTVDGDSRTHNGDSMIETSRLQHAPLLSDSDVMVNETHGIPPFDHITDPNLRNHRLYAWEFENYKNFTHIDREEDLLADESEPIPSVQVVAVAPSSTKPPPVLTTTLIPGGWIPKVGVPKGRFPDFDDSRPTSASDEYTVDSGDSSLNNVIPGVYVKLPSGSETDNPKPTTRPREPLRESSTENRILSYEENSRRNDYRRRHKDHSEETPSKNLRDDFRPSPPELSPPVFVDPDQDFFTSTIRNPSDERLDDLDHVPGYRSPSKKRRRPLSRLTIRHKDEDPRKNRHETTSTRYISSEEDYYKKRDRARLELERDEKSVSKPDRDVPPRPDSFDEREPPRLEQSDLKRPLTSQESHHDSSNDFRPFRKSDRILTHDDEDRKSSSSKTTLIKPKNSYSNEAQGTEHRPYYHSPYGPASNEFEFSNTRERDRDRSEDYHNENNAQRYNTNNNNYNDYGGNNYPQTQYSNVDQGSYYNSNNQEAYNTNHNQPEYSQAHHSQQAHSDSGDHSNAPRDQYYAGGYEHQYNHPFSEDSNSYAPSAYGVEESPSSWPKYYYILGGLVVASALLAFLVPSVLGSMGKRGKVRNDLEDDLTTTADDFVDENTSTSPGAFGSASNTHTSESDPTADTDLWTEIKAVYNDIVNIVRGDYGGIVDKLTGNGSGVSLKGNKKKENKNQNGPNIVYREVEEAEDDEKNDGNDLDAFENDHRRGKMRHRKGIESSSMKNSMMGSSSSSTTEKSNHHHKKNSKSKTLSSTINYMVRNHNTNGYLEETSRAVSSSTPKHNDSLAGFYLGKTLLPSSSTATVTGSNYPSSTEGFMGEWAKVQLIGS